MSVRESLDRSLSKYSDSISVAISRSLWLSCRGREGGEGSNVDTHQGEREERGVEGKDRKGYIPLLQRCKCGCSF